MRRVSLARQLLVLQLVVVLTTVGLVAWVAIDGMNDRTRRGERERALSVARSLALSPHVRAAVRRDDPTAALQPLAEAVRRRADVGFVVFMSPDGIRYSHPDRARIGGRFVGSIEAARRGGEVVEDATGTLGPSARAVVPIGEGGRVDGLVAVGVLHEAIGDQIRDQLPALLASLSAALLIGGLLSLLLARRLRRHTRNMDPEQLGALYAHHDAVLHAIREGVVVVGEDGRLSLVNAEARRLLGLGDAAVGRRVEELVVGEPLVAALTGRGGDATGVHLVGERVLVSATRRTRVNGSHLETVTTLRDRTELEELVRELGTVRGLADALRAQAHESANELHTVVGLVELGRYEDAIAFATRRIGVTQDEAEQIQLRIGDPAIAALLLAKAAACRERGVQLAVADDSELPAGVVPEEDLVTIVGNLIDNALDALSVQRGGRIDVRARTEDDATVIEVRDNGPGIDPEALEHVFEPGWSTKPSTTTAKRGVGLALVAAVTARLGGSATAGNDGGAVFTVRLPVSNRERVSS